MIDATNNDTTTTPIWSPPPLDDAFFDRCGKHLGVKLDHDARKKIHDGLWGTFCKLLVPGPDAATELEMLAGEMKAVLRRYTSIRNQSPALLHDVPDHGTASSEEAQKIPPMTIDTGYTDGCYLDNQMLTLMTLQRGVARKAKNIRRRKPRVNGRPPKDIGVGLIEIAIEVAQSCGKKPAVPKHCTGPFCRLLAELYCWFPERLRPQLAETEKAFLDKARKVLKARKAAHGGKSPKNK